MAIFDEENSIDWDRFFQTEVVQSGHGVFEGHPYQRGFGNRTLRGQGIGNIFRSLFRFLAPVAKKVGKAVGRQALQTGAEVARDFAAGEPIKKSLEQRGRAGAKSLLDKAGKKLEGRGIGNRRPNKRKGGPVRLAVLKKKQKTKPLFTED